VSGVHRLRSYEHLDSPVHRAPAAFKLLTALLLVLAIALVPVSRAGWVVVVLVALVGVARAGRVPLSSFVARVAIAEPFVLGVAILSLFQGRGIAVFLAIALKSTTCVAAVQLLAHTTPFQDILAVLDRARLPRVLVHTLGLLHRYLFVLVEETHRMRRARAARTLSPDVSVNARVDAWAAWKALSSVIAVSFVRSMARADRVHDAMRARGWS
jgi:cobalt/nickel transport system permease protein